MSSAEDVQYLQIPLQHILLATNGFAYQNIIGRGGFGNVYEGKSEKYGRMAIKRLVIHSQGQGDDHFRMEIDLLSKHKHENLVSLLGFCDEEGEKILVYKYESNRSLDRHLNKHCLTWIQRLLICLHAAYGLKYLHDKVERRERIFHRDVKSSNILLDECWNPKISDFGLSRVGPADTKTSLIITHPCGTLGYVDPDYGKKGHLTQKSDVYSFGVVLWEILCGRPALVKEVHLSILAKEHHERKTLYRIIPSYLHKQMNQDSLDKFANIAYQCLNDVVDERPTMKQVVKQLKEAIVDQLELMKPDDGKRVEKHANPAAGDEKKREESKHPLPPPPLPQEFVFEVYMHCVACARKVRKCLKNLEGVENVKTDCETHMVVVKGEKADPSKILERIHNETKRKVKLLSPVLKPTVEEAKKLEQEETCKLEEKKDEEVKKLPQNRKKPIKEAKSAAGDEKKHKVIVGEPKANPLKVQETVPEKCQQKVELQLQVTKLPADRRSPRSLLEQEEPHNQEEKRDDLTSRDIFFFIFIIIIIYFYY